MSTDEQFVSKPLDVKQARAKCEEAAEMLLDKYAPGGDWRWIDDRRLCVYTALGNPFATLHIEDLQ
jgi:hypothetical protein